MDKISKIVKQEKKGKLAPITSKNIDEHRDEVLKAGKKFKYPLQYAKHKVLINTVIVAVAAIIIFSIVSFFALYKQQVQNDFYYAVTKIFPLPIASVDGVDVRYSDYLLRLKSSLHYLQAGGSEVDLNSESGAEYINHIKRQELTEAEKNALAWKIASEHNISVSNEEVNNFIDEAVRTTDASMSLGAFSSTVLDDLYGQTLDEFKSFVKNSILRSKVAKEIDSDAKNKIDSLLVSAKSAPDSFTQLIKDNSDDDMTKANGGKVEVDTAAEISDTRGLLSEAQKLEVGNFSNVIAGVDGYYIIKLDEKTGTKIVYSVLKIAFREFDRQFEALEKSGAIKEYILIQQLDF